MRNMDIFHLSRVAVGIVVGLLFVISVASADEGTLGAAHTWLWSARIAEINQTTSALATGHPARALRFAEMVGTDTLPAAERLIAAHNLCLALVATRSSKADSACRGAVRTPLPATEDRAHVIRGAWTVGVNDPQAHATRLTYLVRVNIARAYGVRIVDRFAEEPW